jgi:MoxR-like ATPase
MYQEIKSFANAIVTAVETKMHGLTDVIRLAIVALYTDGHVLLEGNPGLGKTELVKSLAGTLKLRYGRVQFTPDLMPADITGTYMPGFEGERKLKFRPGPIFTSLLLADEINRATPKTQSAMLEGMAERRVTVLGRTYELPRPFMVLATQNPIDHEGTYDLPEAQADRFMFKVLMPTPDQGTIRKIMVKEAGASAQPVPEPAQSVVPIRDEKQAADSFARIRATIRDLTPRPSVETHILNLVQASNLRFSELSDLGRGQQGRLEKMVRTSFAYGLGPRTAIAMMRAAKAWSLLFVPEVEVAVPEAVARTAAAVLRHRVKLEFDWQRSYAGADQLDPGSSQALETFLADLIVTAAPERDGYQGAIREGLAAAGTRPPAG